MTPRRFWSLLTAAQKNRLSRFQCRGCKRTLRRSLTGSCVCDAIGNAKDCLAASPYPHISDIPEVQQ